MAEGLTRRCFQRSTANRQIVRSSIQRVPSGRESIAAMSRHVINRTSVSTLMGAAVFDASGVLFGHVREFAVDSAADVHQVHALVVRRTAPSGGGTAKVPVM